jgi:peptidoglycan/xylan/chitin deacetylase (PgdA/CDA1 family)
MMRRAAISAAVSRSIVGALDLVSAPRLSILIFHRVVAESDALFPEEMHASRFDRLVARLASSFRVMTLGEAHARWRRQQLPDRALAITFDDGYADNIEVALPILRRHGLSATFFVSTGYLDGGRMWNDTVIESIRACRFPSLDASPLGLGLLPLRDDATRRAAIDRLLAKIKYRDLAGRADALGWLRSACGDPTLPDNLMMRSDQVRSLHEQGMEIGGHTVRHPILTELPDDEARDEIVDGREHLQALTGAPIEVFAYPNGRPGRDYDRRHVEMVRAAGFRCAVSTAQGVVDTRAVDPMQWPRFTPWDLDDTRWLQRLVVSRYLPRAPAVV